HVVSAYFDVEVFRQVYHGGGEPFTPFFLGETTDAGRAFEAVIRAMYQRSLLSSHTLNPDLDNLDAWLDNLFERVQPLYLNVEEWVRAFNNPDERLIQELGIRTEFYNVEDPSIQMARNLQAGKPVSDALRHKVFEERLSTCAYGQILQLGLQY